MIWSGFERHLEKVILLNLRHAMGWKHDVSVNNYKLLILLKLNIGELSVSGR